MLHLAEYQNSRVLFRNTLEIAPGSDPITLLITPMFLVCGVFYPIETLPAALHSVVQVLPLTHAVALARPLVSGGEVTQPLLHIGVLLAYALVSYYVAVALVRRRLQV